MNSPFQPSSATHAAEWPSLARTVSWPATQDYIHLVTQMMGKLRLSLAPTLPEWAHAALALTPRGLTTRVLPTPNGAVEVRLDFVDSALHIGLQGGASRLVPLAPARAIAEIWTDYQVVLRDLGVTVEMWDKPQERSDTTPFAQDLRPRDYDPVLGAAWFRLMMDVHNFYDEWRSPFFGRSAVNFWWGGFDLAVTLFNGRRAVPPPRSNYLMRYDLDAEHLSVGFWPGDDQREAMFFSYIVPDPPGCEQYPFDVPSASWATAMGEWVLPYESIRALPERWDLVRAFMDTVYRAAGELAGWAPDSFTYALPPHPRAVDPATRGQADRTYSRREGRLRPE